MLETMTVSTTPAHMPKVSVAIAAYNEMEFIDRCLRSLANQRDFNDFEVVVVDDASSDGTLTVVERFSEEMNLRIIRNIENRGIGASAGRAVAECRGRFIVRVDADDFVSENFLGVLFAAVSAPGAAPAYRCDYLLVGDAEEVMGRRDAQAFPIACGIIMSRESLATVGLYDPGLRTGEDVEFEARYRDHFNIGHIPIPLYRYRQHDNNSSGGMT